MQRELLAMGADEAVLVSGREFGGSDTYATSQILAAAIHKLGIEKDDIIFCGRQAIDGDTAQVGPQIAEKLGLPQITYVAELKKESGKVVCKRMLEDGYMEVEAPTPCLLTCIKELNTPRYMTIAGIMECMEKPMQVFDYQSLAGDSSHRSHHHRSQGLSHQHLQVIHSSQKGGGIMLEGSGKEACDTLVNTLLTKHLI